MPLLNDGLVGTSALHALAVAIVLMAATVPLALRLAYREQRPWLVWLILGSLLLHFAGSVLQIAVVRMLYDNSADFHLYNGQGRDLLQVWLSGEWQAPSRQIPGTGSVIMLTALTYAVFGVDQLGGFFVFSWFGLLGLIAFYRAFRVAIPDASDARYAAMIFLLPSLWYWPTVTGKEALMLPALGLMALGASHLLARRVGGIVPLLIGSTLGGLIRPHEVALVFGAYAIALLLRRRARRTLAGPVQWIGLFLLVAVGGTLLAWFTARYLGLSELSSEAVVALVNEANENTQGEGAGYGSSHSDWNISPLYLPYDAVLVLFKPLPWEVTNAGQAIAAAENLTLLALFLVSWRPVLTMASAFRRAPLVLMSATYSVAFIYLFSALANAGLLVRERTLLFPFLFVLLCWRSPRETDRGLDAETSPSPTLKALPLRADHQSAAGQDLS